MLHIGHVIIVNGQKISKKHFCKNSIFYLSGGTPANGNYSNFDFCLGAGHLRRMRCADAGQGGGPSPKKGHWGHRGNAGPPTPCPCGR